MEGVTILNEYLTNDWTTGLVPLIFGGMILILSIWGAVAMFKDNESGYGISLSVLAFLSAVLVGAGVFMITATPEKHYQVTIEDSVSMNEFLEKYEIVDQEGQIITVKEREANG